MPPIGGSNGAAHVLAEHHLRHRFGAGVSIDCPSPVRSQIERRRTE
jgi:hypothetical protein